MNFQEYIEAKWATSGALVHIAITLEARAAECVGNMMQLLHGGVIPRVTWPAAEAAAEAAMLRHWAAVIRSNVASLDSLEPFLPDNLDTPSESR